MNQHEQEEHQLKLVTVLVEAYRRDAPGSMLTDSEQARNFFSPEQVHALGAVGLYLAKGEDLPALTVAFSGLLATLGLVQQRLSDSGQELEAGLLAGVQESLHTLVRDIYYRFGYDIHLGVSAYEERNTHPEDN